MSEWEDGFASGWAASVRNPSSGRSYEIMEKSRGKRYGVPKGATYISPKPKKPKRKASAYSKRYGKAFKRLAPKFKKKSGGWKKNGFKRCAAAARKAAKK